MLKRGQNLRRFDLQQLFSEALRGLYLNTLLMAQSRSGQETGPRKRERGDRGSAGRVAGGRRLAHAGLSQSLSQMSSVCQQSRRINQHPQAVSTQSKADTQTINFRQKLSNNVSKYFGNITTILSLSDGILV